MFRVDGEILDSEAFASLNATEIKILLGFMRRREWDRKKKRWKNSRTIIYTVVAMEYEANVSHAHALRARNVLIEKGFVDLIKQADPQKYGEQQMPNSYGISNRFPKWHPDPEQRKRNGFKTHPPLAKKPAPSTAFKSKPQFNVVSEAGE